MQALDFYLFLFSITFVQGFQWSCWPDSQLVPPCFISLLAIPISKQLIVHLVKQPVFPNEKKKRKECIAYFVWNWGSSTFCSFSCYIISFTYRQKGEWEIAASVSYSYSRSLSKHIPYLLLFHFFSLFYFVLFSD